MSEATEIAAFNLWFAAWRAECWFKLVRKNAPGTPLRNLVALETPDEFMEDRRDLYREGWLARAGHRAVVRNGA
jgi:hypothetical protein